MPHLTPRSIPLASGLLERLALITLYLVTYFTLRPVLGPPLPARWQRRLLALAGKSLPAPHGATYRALTLGGVPCEEVTRTRGHSAHVMLYLHGGAFLVGSPLSHRPLTAPLALETGARIVVVDYRLEPEHPYPAALDDCLAVYESLLAQGIPPSSIVVAGDSAGGALSLTLALRLKRADRPQPAGLLLISPVTGVPLDSPSHWRYQFSDPMLRPSCLAAVSAIMGKAEHPDERTPVLADLTGLPPLLIQVGRIEALLDDSLELATQATRCGVPVRLEVCAGLWHVNQLYGAYLASARASVSRLADEFLEMTHARVNGKVTGEA